MSLSVENDEGEWQEYSHLLTPDNDGDKIDVEVLRALSVGRESSKAETGGRSDGYGVSGREFSMLYDGDVRSNGSGTRGDRFNTRGALDDSEWQRKVRSTGNYNAEYELGSVYSDANTSISSLTGSYNHSIASNLQRPFFNNQSRNAFVSSSSQRELQRELDAQRARYRGTDTSNRSTLLNGNYATSSPPIQNNVSSPGTSSLSRPRPSSASLTRPPSLYSNSSGVGSSALSPSKRASQPGIRDDFLSRHTENEKQRTLAAARQRVANTPLAGMSLNDGSSVFSSSSKGFRDTPSRYNEYYTSNRYGSTAGVSTPTSSSAGGRTYLSPGSATLKGRAATPPPTRGRAWK